MGDKPDAGPTIGGWSIVALIGALTRLHRGHPSAGKPRRPIASAPEILHSSGPGG